MRPRAAPPPPPTAPAGVGPDAADAPGVPRARPQPDRTPGSPAARASRERLVAHHLPRLDAACVEYRPLDGPHPWQTRPGVAGWPRDRAEELAAGGLRGVGGWVEGRDEDAGGPA